MGRGDLVFYGTLVAMVLIGGGVLFYNYGCQSRRTLNPGGKTLEYELPADFKKMINVSSGGSEGDLMVTYENTNGDIITTEYNRKRLFETTTIWTRPSSDQE